jgi:hypothetical protein
LDPCPAEFEGGQMAHNGNHVVLKLAGTPTQMGRQYGTLMRTTIRFVIGRYLGELGIPLEDSAAPSRKKIKEQLLELRPALPPAFLEELDACAAAAGLDPDLLLLAQAEGDFRAVYRCSSYVAFGPATRDGHLEAGRNLDYGIDEETVRRGSLLIRYAPDGKIPFLAAGFAGLLTGATLVNAHGLIAANHLGGGKAVNPKGFFTFLLLRRIAEEARTVEEGLAILQASPRMRGQIIWMAQEKDGRTGRPARAVAAEYDAQQITEREAKNGRLVITNANLLFHGPVEEERIPCSRYQILRKAIAEAAGQLDGTRPLQEDPRIRMASTLHSAFFLPSQGIMRLRFQRRGSILSPPEDHPFP